MTFRRILLVSLVALCGGLAAIVLYVAFGDLGRHRPLIEKIISDRTGRSFTIEGSFELDVLPALSISAEHVRLANAEWGTEQPMVEIGRFATVIDFWSLISGPVEVRRLELDDVIVLLERSADGAANWQMREPGPHEAEVRESGMTEVPVVIADGRATDLRLTYRVPGKDDRVALLKTLTIAPGNEGLLAIAADGELQQYATALEGEIGPVEALVSGRDIRVAVEASVGNLDLKLDGGIGRLYPLDGADLRGKLRNPDVATMLKNLQLPVLAEGSLEAEASLTDAGDGTRLAVDATLGDIHATLRGSLAALGIAGSESEFTATVGDVARLAAVFGLEGVPQQQLRLRGHVKGSGDAVELQGVTAELPGIELRLDGSLPRTRQTPARLQFAADVDRLGRLRASLPDVPTKARGTYVSGREGFSMEDLQLLVGGSEIEGTASVQRIGRRRLEAKFSSSHIDLAPFRKQETSAGKGKPPPESVSGGTGAQQKYVFRDTPLPLEALRRVDAHIEFTVAELVLEAGLLMDVEGVATTEGGRLSLDVRAKGPRAGTFDADVKLVPTQTGADLVLTAAIHDHRSMLMAAPGDDGSKSPPTNVDVDIRVSGTSPRQMAAGANGRVLVTQGKGQVKRNALNMLGSDILNQLATRLNPFADADPHTTLECTVLQVTIVDGKATIDPVLIQSKKVTVVGQGTVDLRTENLSFDFNTRPREGIGISPGMFTNPFVQVAGTLAHPRLATGTKGLASGAVAWGTGGISVLAKGLVDRVTGEMDLCATTLAEVSGNSK